jgi:hypothetical protein
VARPRHQSDPLSKAPNGDFEPGVVRMGHVRGY